MSDNKGVKVMSSPRIPRDRCLMFSGRVQQDHALLFEGPVDALKGHLCGGNVASMGAVVTPGQINVLRRKKIRKLYLGHDPDAVQEAVRLVRTYGHEFECFRLEVPSGYKDAGDMSMEEVLEMYRTAKPMYAWQLYFYFRGVQV
jgi:DNA primase